MIHRLLSLLLLCFCVASTLLAQTKDYGIEIGDFTELTIADNINVVYKSSVDSAGWVTFTCHPSVAHVINLTNKKGKLKVSLDTVGSQYYRLPELTVYSARLTKASNNSDSTLCLLTPTPCEKLSLNIIGNGTIQALNVYVTTLSASIVTGNGHIFVSGKTKEAKFNMEGTGVIEARDLKAQNVSAWMIGTGNIDCCADKSLSVYGAGSGAVYYSGSPSIKKRNMGIDIININDPKD